MSMDGLEKGSAFLLSSLINFLKRFIQYNSIGVSTKAHPKRNLRARAKSVSDKENNLVATGSTGRASNQKSILKPNPPSSSMNALVATNCELTNTVIDLNKKILDKQNEYEKLTILLFAEKKEKWFLQHKIERRENTIKELERTIQTLRDSKYCDDLIQLNDFTTTAVEGNFVNFGMMNTFLEKKSCITFHLQFRGKHQFTCLQKHLYPVRLLEIQKKFLRSYQKLCIRVPRRVK